jgi:hypothetical protein
MIATIEKWKHERHPSIELMISIELIYGGAECREPRFVT